MSKQAYPLSWPNGWKRTPSNSRRVARFAKKETVYGAPDSFGKRVSWNRSKQITIADAVARILHELDAMSISTAKVVISTNVEPRLDGLPRSGREPEDPGAAVYWETRNSSRCMAIDMYDRVADNLAAIAATLSAMRAIERHGGATILDRAFIGFAALPEMASQAWREVLGFGSGPANMEGVEARFRALCKVHHPDVGGDPEKFQEIMQARDAARMELQ